MSKKLHILFLPVLLILFQTPVFGDELEAMTPGLNECLLDALGKAMIRQCYLEADKYWGQKLEKVYPRLLARCKQAANPEACRKKTIKMEKAWLEYQELMGDIIFRNGLDKQANENPDVDQYEDSGKFIANSTMNQFKLINRIVNGE